MIAALHFILMFYIDPPFILYSLLLLTNNICIYIAGKSAISFKHYYKQTECGPKLGRP
jgi:hypothetical protein